MCNLSENIKALGIEEGIKKERLNAINRMMSAGLTKNLIMLCGYTEDELHSFQISTEASG